MLSRLTAAVYRYLVLGVFLAVSGLPTVVFWSLLSPQPANAVLFVAALAPVAPALSAALYAQRAWAAEPDLKPAKPLVRGLRLNTRDTLAWWIPMLALTAVLAVNILFADAVPGGELLRPVCAVLMAAAAVWSGHLLVVSSFFSFRFRDVLRVAAAEFFLSWKATLGILALLVVATATVLLSSRRSCSCSDGCSASGCGWWCGRSSPTSPSGSPPKTERSGFKPPGPVRSSP
ncbi:hypothetical protein GCM10029992_32830 [Glycomyces albus]